MSLSKKLRRLIIKLVVIIVLVLIILIAGGILFIDHIVKIGIEKGVPAVLGDDIAASVNHLHIEPFNARVEVGDLIIGNPEGFSTEYAFKLGEVVADIDLGTVTKDKIHIEHLRLKDIDVIFEQPLKSRSNLKEILSRLEKKEKEEKEKPKEEKKEKKESKEKTFQIDKLEIENVGVTLKVSIGPKLPAHFSITPIENLGVEGDGITATDLAYVILGAIIEETFKLDAVSDVLSAAGEAITGAVSNVTGAAKETASNAVNNVSDAANKTADGVKETGSNLANTATEAGKNFTQGIGNTAQSLSNTAAEAGKNFTQGIGNTLGGLGGLGGGKKTEEEAPAQPQGN